jgi:hypothetical protein
MTRKPTLRRIRPGARSFLLVPAFVAAALVITAAARAKLETWREDTATVFAKGRRDHVVVSDGGRIRLGQSLAPLGTLDAARVWDLVRTPGGDLYAATGDAGKVFRREAREGSAWSVAYDARDTQALALAVLPDGHVVVGTGPSGQLIDLTDPEHPAVAPDRSIQYFWDLAADPQGNLYAATGPSGQLWKRSAAGKWSLLLDTRHSHLLCVAVGSDGAVYAGSDGEGLIYRVAPDGKASVVYDAPQSEIRTLRFGPDGALYAGTAAEAGGGGGGRGSLVFSAGDRGDPGSAPGGPGSGGGTRPVEVQKKADAAPSRSGGSGTPSGGAALPRPVSAGDNSVYRIEPDGVPREIFRVKALIHALAWQGDRLLVATGPEGQLYEVRSLGQESAPIARLDNGQILALCDEPSGNLLLGTGDPGGVVRLESGYVERGTIVSTVHDTKLISRFGALSWRAECPEGTTLSLEVRTGNVAEPDATWSEWSRPQTDLHAARALVPPGRFVQYRATLATRVPAVSPELRSVAVTYQSANLPPEINRIDVPDIAAGDGTTRQTRLTLRWDVTDPNGDELSYTLQIRKDGWPEWVPLGTSPLTETSFAWDTTAVPPGLYRVRLVATDRPSNNPADALSRERTSEPFLIDHESPSVTIVPQNRGALVTLKDNLTRLAKAAYAVDSGEWVSVFPDDGLFDTPNETITIRLADLKPGTHVLMVRGTDAAGNVGSGDALIEIR